MAEELTRLRCWAVEQAVAMAGRVTADQAKDGLTVGMPRLQIVDPKQWALGLAGEFLAYVTEPVRQADRQLLEAARAFDGSQNAGALIGMLADALEGRIAGRSGGEVG